MPRMKLAAALVAARIAIHVPADTIDIESSTVWRTTSPAPPAGWNTQVGFDDSDAAGWQSAFKSPTGNHIWMTSNMSGQSPNQAWFRFVFNLPNTITSASGSFFFDDDGEAYINGQQVVNDASLRRARNPVVGRTGWHPYEATSSAVAPFSIVQPNIAVLPWAVDA